MAPGAQGRPCLVSSCRPFAQMSQEAQQGEQVGGRGGRQLGPAPAQPCTWLHLPRYSILPHSDLERCFSIEPEDGTIRTAGPLDREARVWHNLTVLATELGEESWASRRAGRRRQPPGRGAVPGDGVRGVLVPHTPTQGITTRCPAWILTTRQALWSPGLDWAWWVGLSISPHL